MDYSDIINKSRPESLRHKKMSNYERAAQFSPFSALTGYEAAVTEAARLTDSKHELDEDTNNMLNERFAILKNKLDNNKYDISDEKCRVTITYFIQDELKDGGRYEDYSGYVRTIDEYDRIIIMQDGKKININDICNIVSEIFHI